MKRPGHTEASVGYFPPCTFVLTLLQTSAGWQDCNQLQLYASWSEMKMDLWQGETIAPGLQNSTGSN